MDSYIKTKKKSYLPLYVFVIVACVYVTSLSLCLHMWHNVCLCMSMSKFRLCVFVVWFSLYMCLCFVSLSVMLLCCKGCFSKSPYLYICCVFFYACGCVFLLVPSVSDCEKRLSLFLCLCDFCRMLFLHLWPCMRVSMLHVFVSVSCWLIQCVIFH